MELSKLDFSEDVYNAFKKQYPNSCAANTQFKFKVAIEGYKPVADDKNDGFALSYLFQVDFQNAEPISAKNAPISFSVTKKQPDNKLNIGDVQQQEITINNLSGQAQGMVVAILSTSSCFEMNMNQLELLKDRGSFDNYEISPDKTLITLYWTYLKEKEKKNVQLTFVKKFGGAKAICQRRASQAYLYY